MNTLVDKNISSSEVPTIHRIDIDDRSNDDTNNHSSYLYRFTRWLHRIKLWQHESTPEGQVVLGSNITDDKDEIMCISDIPFFIPRQLKDVRQEETTSDDFERAKLIIKRMDEYLVSPEDQDEAKRQRHADTSLGLLALAAAADTIQKASFREVLSVDETLKDAKRRVSQAPLPGSTLLHPLEKIDAITDFQEAHDFIEFEEALDQHRKELSTKEPTKPSDMLYLKFCLLMELQRDEYESCLRIFLHDIIFKFHLSDFRLRCELHVKNPIQADLFLEKVVDGSHLTSNYSAEFILWSANWIVQQDVELYVIMKIESLSINKYISPKFWDVAHLQVKNIPHGASKMFLRELTPVSRPHRILSRGLNVGQIEIEATYLSEKSQLSIHIIKISHSQAERLLGAPDTYVEAVFQGPFKIYDIQRTKVVDNSINPKFDEEFLFDIPEKLAVSDTTVDLVFLEKSSLIQNSTVLGVLTLSKHTDWFPVRKFWATLEENPDITLKDRFLFEGNDDDD